VFLSEIGFQVVKFKRRFSAVGHVEPLGFPMARRISWKPPLARQLPVEIIVLFLLLG